MSVCKDKSKGQRQLLSLHSALSFDAAIFDADGTLLDSMSFWDNIGAIYLRERGIEPEPGLAEKLFPMSMEEAAEYLRSRYGLPESAERIRGGIADIIGRFYGSEVTLKPGVRDLLCELKERGIPAAVATGSDSALVGSALRMLGVADSFEFIIDCSELNTTKKEPLIYNYAAERLGASAGHTVVFEDTLQAVRTAKNAGFIVAAVEDMANASDADGIRALADVFIKDFNEYCLPGAEAPSATAIRLRPAADILELSSH